MPIAHAGRWTRRALFGGALALLASPSFAQDKASAVRAFDHVERIEWDEATGVPTFLAGDLGATSKTTAAGDFFAANREVFRLSPDDIQTTSTQTDELGLTHVRVRQTVDGVPVFGGDAALHLDREGSVYAYGGTVHPAARTVATRPQVGRADALAAARAVLGPVTERQPDAPDELGHQGSEWTPSSELVIYPHQGTYLLAYHVRLFVDAPQPANWNVFVDAATGQVVHRFNDLHTFDPRAESSPRATYAEAAEPLAFISPQNGTGTSTFGGTLPLETYLYSNQYYLYDTTRGPQYIRTMTANNGTSLPGSYVTDADNSFTSSTQKAAVDAHYGAVATYDYYQNTHGRNSYNGSGANITSTVHYSSSYNNAFWNGSQMVYGDGDGYTFLPLVELDIVAHELTHAVTSSTANLIYQYESGALNESVSDVFAAMVDRNDWTVGELSYTPGTSGDALRSLSNPPAGDQPDHYSDRYTGSGDNGGVHINSGIPNKAAYLMSEGGTHRGVSVTGIGRAKTEAIWYRALTQYFTSSTNLAGARQGLLSATADLYGSGGSEYAAVQNAFAAVGIGSGSSGGGGGGTGGGTPQWYYETVSYESGHPYSNYTNTTDTYTKAGATRVAMYFERFELENNYDFVYIKDASNQTTATCTGTRSAFWAIVDGATIKANFVSDYSVTDWGWRVSQVAYYSDQPLLASDPDALPLATAPEAAASDEVPAVLLKGLTTELSDPRPNPAAGAATLPFSLAEAAHVRLAVFDALGREVALLHDGQLDAGEHTAVLPANAAPSGVYIVTMDANKQRLTKRLTLVR